MTEHELEPQPEEKLSKRWWIVAFVLGCGAVGAEVGMQSAHYQPRPCQDVIMGFSRAICVGQRPVWQTVVGAAVGLLLGVAVWLFLRWERVASLTTRVIACAICVVLALTLSASSLMAHDNDAVAVPSDGLLDRIRRTNYQLATLNGDQYADVLKHGLTPAAVRRKIFETWGLRVDVLYIGALTQEGTRDASGRLLFENVIVYAYERKRVPTTSSGPAGVPRVTMYQDQVEFIDAHTGEFYAGAAF